MQLHTSSWVFHLGLMLCRQYRTDVAKKMVMFLSAVKASLTGLGVDANRLTRITTEVSGWSSHDTASHHMRTHT